MIRASLLVFGFLASLAALQAADVPSAPAYELKNRSTFGINKNARAPFWPIGWRKDLAAPVQTSKVPIVKAFQIQAHHFNVTSVLLANPPVAIINGRGFAEGEILPVTVGDTPVQVMVRQIRDGGVWLEQGTHQVFVPLKREALPTRGNSDTPAAKETFKIQIQDR